MACLSITTLTKPTGPCNVIFNKDYGKFLGQGGFGTVVSKYDPFVGDTIALKRSVIKGSLQESLGLLVSHKNLLPILRILTSHDCHNPDMSFRFIDKKGKQKKLESQIKKSEIFVLMPLMSTSLHDFIESDDYSKIKPGRLVQQLLDANRFLARYNLYQMDSKSANILVEFDRRSGAPNLRLTDFGGVVCTERLRWNKDIVPVCTVWYRPVSLFFRKLERGPYISVFANAIVAAELLLRVLVIDYAKDNYESLDTNIPWKKLDKELDKSHPTVHVLENYCQLQYIFLREAYKKCKAGGIRNFIGESMDAVETYIWEDDIQTTYDLDWTVDRLEGVDSQSDGDDGVITLNIPDCVESSQSHEMFLNNLSRTYISGEIGMTKLMCFLQNLLYLSNFDLSEPDSGKGRKSSKGQRDRANARKKGELTRTEIESIAEMVDNVIQSNEISRLIPKLLSTLKGQIRPWTVFDFCGESDIESVCGTILQPGYWDILRSMDKSRVDYLSKRYRLKDFPGLYRTIKSLTE